MNYKVLHDTNAKIISFPTQNIKQTKEEYSEFKSDGKLKARPMQSIQSYDDFDAMQRYFLDRNKIRDWAIWVVGICFGLRVSDLLKIKVGWVINPDKTFREKLTIIENKTNKLNGIALTEGVIATLTRYFCSLDTKPDLNDFLFRSQKKGKLTEQSVWRILSAAGSAALPRLIIGSHTLRKSHVNIIACLLKTNIDPNMLLVAQLTLNHSNSKTTMKYLDLLEPLLDKGRSLVSDFVLGKSGVNELSIGI